jgi:anaerobic selenocysteine-containing dehydrogenase
MARSGVPGACPRDRCDTCGLRLEPQGGRVTRVTGDERHPLARGVLCVKANRYGERLNHPDRVLQPCRRVGAKGEGRSNASAGTRRR